MLSQSPPGILGSLSDWESPLIATEDPAKSESSSRPLRHALVFLVSLYLLILALELIKGGASSLSSLLGLEALGESPSSTGSFGALGLGWLLACLLLSGSPVAALSLVFLAEGTLSPHASFSMIMGSRMGASFLVLVIGFVYDLRLRQAKGGTYVGALAFLTTASVYLPAWGLGYLLVSSGWIDKLELPGASQLFSVIDFAFGYAKTFAAETLPPWVQATAGIVLLLAAFKLFDLAIPTVDPTGGRIGRMATTIYRPSVAFLFGMLVTAVTLSVSVSLTLLVPLTVRGIVRRENLIPFILGANITTFADTVVAGILVGDPSAFAVVVCAIIVVSAMSVPIVFAFYRPYETAIDTAAVWLTRNGYRLAFFVLLVLVVPLLLILPLLLTIVRRASS